MRVRIARRCPCVALVLSAAGVACTLWIELGTLQGVSAEAGARWGPAWLDPLRGDASVAAFTLSGHRTVLADLGGPEEDDLEEIRGQYAEAREAWFSGDVLCPDAPPSVRGSTVQVSVCSNSGGRPAYVATVFHAWVEGPELLVPRVTNHRNGRYTFNATVGRPGFYAMHVELRHKGFPFDPAAGSTPSVVKFRQPILGTPFRFTVAASEEPVRPPVPWCASAAEATRGRWVRADADPALAVWHDFLHEVTRDPFVWQPDRCRLRPVHGDAARRLLVESGARLLAAGDSHVRQAVDLLVEPGPVMGGRSGFTVEATPHSDRHKHRDWNFTVTRDGAGSAGAMRGRVMWVSRAGARGITLPSIERLVEHARTDAGGGWGSGLFVFDLTAGLLNGDYDEFAAEAERVTASLERAAGSLGRPVYVTMPPANGWNAPWFQGDGRGREPWGAPVRVVAMNRMAVSRFARRGAADVFDLHALAESRFTDERLCSSHWLCGPQQATPVGAWSGIILANLLVAPDPAAAPRFLGPNSN